MTYAWIDYGNGRKVFRKVREDVRQRSHLPAPRIRPDGMSSAVWNPVDGKQYESRSAYERAVKDAGCEIVGDDAGHWNKPAPTFEPEGIKEDIVKAWNELS